MQGRFYRLYSPRMNRGQPGMMPFLPHSLQHEPREIRLFTVTTLLAQIDMGPVSIPSLIAALSGGGFSLWYGWYTTSVTIPKIVADFREEIKTERAFHEAQIDKLIAAIDRLIASKVAGIDLSQAH